MWRQEIHDLTDRAPSDDELPPENFTPGSLGCHEAMHLASVFRDMVAQHLVDHPAITAKPAWAALADEAMSALSRLYRVIGEEHMQR